MLTEHFIAATCYTKAAEVAGISCPPASKQPSKDEGVFVYAYQPQQITPRTVFKKSSTLPNCLDVSDRHVFAAQADSGLVHVYARDTGVLETVVPFPGRIECIKLTLKGTVLVAGLRNGEVVLWETLAGRIITIPHTHLQKVTSLATDSSYLLTGSADTTIYVWTLLNILSYTPSNSYSSDSDNTYLPLYTLTSHRAQITALATSPTPSASPSTCIAVSCARDSAVIVWNIESGDALCTFLAAGPPTGIVIDPAERAAYISMEDGRVQMLDFHRRHGVEAVSRSPRNNTTSHSRKRSRNDTQTRLKSIFGPLGDDNLIQPPSSSVWSTKEAELDAALSITLSWDGSTLLTGHANGTISSWDIGGGVSTGVVYKLSNPSTNIMFLPPTGFPETTISSVAGSSFTQHLITKPKRMAPNMSISGATSHPYTLHTVHNVSFPTTLPTPRFLALMPSTSTGGATSFGAELTSAVFSEEVLEEGISELAAMREGRANGTLESEFAEEEDIIMLKGPTSSEKAEGNGVRELTLKEQNAQLRVQVGSLQRTLGVTLEEMKKRGWGVGDVGGGDGGVIELSGGKTFKGDDRDTSWESSDEG